MAALMRSILSSYTRTKIVAAGTQGPSKRQTHNYLTARREGSEARAGPGRLHREKGHGVPRTHTFINSTVLTKDVGWPTTPDRLTWQPCLQQAPVVLHLLQPFALWSRLRRGHTSQSHEREEPPSLSHEASPIFSPSSSLLPSASVHAHGRQLGPGLPVFAPQPRRKSGSHGVDACVYD